MRDATIGEPRWLPGDSSGTVRRLRALPGVMGMDWVVRKARGVVGALVVDMFGWDDAFMLSARESMRLGPRRGGLLPCLLPPFLSEESAGEPGAVDVALPKLAVGSVLERPSEGRAMSCGSSALVEGRPTSDGLEEGPPRSDWVEEDGSMSPDFDEDDATSPSREDDPSPSLSLSRDDPSSPFPVLARFDLAPLPAALLTASGSSSPLTSVSEPTSGVIARALKSRAPLRPYVRLGGARVNGAGEEGEDDTIVDSC